MKLRPIGKEWCEYQGAEEFPDGSPPLFATVGHPDLDSLQYDVVLSYESTDDGHPYSPIVGGEDTTDDPPAGVGVFDNHFDVCWEKSFPRKSMAVTWAQALVDALDGIIGPACNATNDEGAVAKICQVVIQCEQHGWRRIT